ncbi:uncharacterized protein LOC116846165 [Odontomachus brunneus]|uniref:uncharacterized protein LOC116846165 n=1 Tax=Odontomachus brunneus TaxID=486640 RepID=UPI0013F228AC|nr:uncharacterized protein LOC116846165 [Odontomachus brunneus]
MYTCLRRLREEGEDLSAGTIGRIRALARRRALRRWKRQLGGPNVPGRRTIEAIRPCLLEWVDRGHGGLSFHLTQVLTGHGCFGEYLCRIGKECTAHCHHCAADRDTAQHTLAECQAWAADRGVLIAVVGGDLSLPAVVRAIVGSKETWEAVVSFCSSVMGRKEAAERVRRGEAEVVPLPPSTSSSEEDEKDEVPRRRARRGRRWRPRPPQIQGPGGEPQLRGSPPT